MIRVAVTEAQPGDVLARSVLNPSRPEQTLLKRGVELNGRIIAALGRYGIRSVWLQGDGMGYLEELVSEERFDAGRRALGELKTTFAKMSRDVRYEGGFAAYRDRVIEIFQSIRDNRPVYCLLDDIRAREGDVLFHGGNVCYLSMLLGLELESYIFEERRRSAGVELAGQMAPLGLGALLHDVGKLLLPEPLRARRPWELTLEERDAFREHTVKGFALLRPQLGAITANMALCHHKNHDGGGYPEELAESGGHLPDGERIHVFSRVVAVANAYEELVGYGDYLPVEALEELNCARRHHFDPKVLRALNRIVPPFGLGNAVRLSSGHYGMVVDFDPDHPFLPTVALLRDPEGDPLPKNKRVEVKLADYPQFRVRSVAGRGVEHLLPERPNATWEDMP